MNPSAAGGRIHGPNVFLPVVISVPIPPDEPQGYGGPQAVGHHHGQPDAVQTQHQREQEDHSAPEQEGPQEGDEGGHRPVAQGGEKGGAVYAEAHKEVAQGKDAEAVDCHVQQLLAVAHESSGQGLGQQLRRRHHSQGGQYNYRHALAEDTF